MSQQARHIMASVLVVSPMSMVPGTLCLWTVCCAAAVFPCPCPLSSFPFFRHFQSFRKSS